MHVTREARLTAWRLSFAVTLTAAVVAALLPQPPDLPIAAINDKWAHAIAFTTLALLAAFAYPETPLTRIGERLSFLGALIEVLQSIPALHRDCDVRDWLADTAAAVVMLGLIALIRRHATRSSEDHGSL